MAGKMTSKASRTAGQIIPRGEDTWLVRVSLGRDETGKRHTYNKTVHGKRKDAQRHLTEKLRELDTGSFVKPTKETKQTLRAYLASWLDSKRANPRTLSDYRWLVKKYIHEHTIGRVQLEQVSPAAVRRLYLDLQAQGLSPRTVQYLHSVLRQALGQAVEDGLLARNPADKRARKVLEKVERSEKQVLSLAGAQVFIQAVQTDRYGALWLLLLDTGLRPGEALGLKWSDLDGNVIRVQRALKEPRLKGETWRLERPKTKQAVRSVPLMRSTVDALKEYRKKQLELRLKAGEHWADGCDPDLIFTTEIGTYLRKSNLHRRHFKPILKAAKLPDMRIYDLRHSAATILLALGENPKVVQERLGHRDVKLTLDTYSHVVEGLQAQATAKLEAAFGVG
jgi:integrase